MRETIIALCAASILVVVLIAGAVFVGKVGENDVVAEAGQSDLAGFRVLFVGERRGLFDQILGVMSSRGAEVIDLGNGSVSASIVSRYLGDGSVSVIVLFDPAWIRSHIDDPELHDALREAVYRGAPLISTGDDSGSLFVALDKAGIDRITFSEGGRTFTRNPGDFKAEGIKAVGFKLYTFWNPYENRYSHSPSIMSIDSSSIDSLISYIKDWAGSVIEKPIITASGGR